MSEQQRQQSHCAGNNKPLQVADVVARQVAGPWLTARNYDGSRLLLSRCSRWTAPSDRPPCPAPCRPWPFRLLSKNEAFEVYANISIPGVQQSLLGAAAAPAKC